MSQKPGSQARTSHAPYAVWNWHGKGHARHMRTHSDNKIRCFIVARLKAAIFANLQRLECGDRTFGRIPRRRTNSALTAKFQCCRSWVRSPNASRKRKHGYVPKKRRGQEDKCPRSQLPYQQRRGRYGDDDTLLPPLHARAEGIIAYRAPSVQSASRPQLSPVV
ncbi:hypothetical protein VNI00_017671 [Paramarasmius palmivorus]|uniref:Uncharacterized protein n=1 Tax=Paramarasmius palmivorus TaxID=297713 RepID=A0AAW0B4V6_9AGAR